jgi:FkbM family methyltransferase
MVPQNYWTRSTRYVVVRYIRLRQRLWLGVVMRLNKRVQADLFMRLGQRLRVTSAQVQNGHGIFEGFLKDEKLFKYVLSDGTWSPRIIDLFTQACKELPTGTFLDLGANIGLITVPMAKRNPHLSVVAIEAEPRAFGLLEKNLASNQVDGEQVIRINQAIYKQGGMVSFELSEDNYGDGRVRKADVTNVQEQLKESTRQTIEVPAQKLDDMLAAYALPAPFVMKADIQGSEHFILSGGSETLRRTELLVIEFWPYGLRRVGADPLEFFDQLVTYFDLGCLDDTAPGQGGWVEAGSLRAQVARFTEQALSHQGIDLILAKAAFAQRVTL